MQADGQGRLRPEGALRPGRARADVGVGEHVVRHHPRRRHRGERVQLQLGRSRVAPESARQRAVVPRSAERGHARDGPRDRTRSHLLPARAGAARQHGAARSPIARTRRPTCSRRRCSRRPTPATSTSATLAPDDQQAVCDIYPAAHDPMTCAPGHDGTAGGCSCSAAGAPLSALASLRPARASAFSRRARGGGAAEIVGGWQRSRASLAGRGGGARGGWCRPAWGFVRKKTDGGLAEYWQPSCIQLDVYINDFAGHVPRRDRQVDQRRRAHLEPDRGDLPRRLLAPVLRDRALAGARQRARHRRPAYDGHNTLQFYTAGSPYPANSALGGSTIALTSVWARADGHIVDADVQVNALDNPFANLDPGYVVGRRQSTRSICRTPSPTSSGICSASATPAGISSATSTSRSTTWMRASRCATPAARRRQGHGDVRDHRQRRRNDEAQPVARRHPGCLRDLSGQRRSARVRAGHAGRRLRLPHGRAASGVELALLSLLAIVLGRRRGRARRL